jgi:methylmalonyl-CoA/ethylmalonyl-CoA epimerase
MTSHARRARRVTKEAAVLTCIDHVGIACWDLAEKIAMYESVFGLTVVSTEVSQEQGVTEAMLLVADGAGRAAEMAARAAAGLPADARLAAPSYVQLLQPLGPDTPVGRFLARRGEGIHHIGYGVTDITVAMASIGASGVRLLDARPRHGSMGASIAFMHPADVGGVLTELVQLPGGYAGGGQAVGARRSHTTQICPPGSR